MIMIQTAAWHLMEEITFQLKMIFFSYFQFGKI